MSLAFSFTTSTADTYASDGVKHCVRPYDMTGRSAAFILRHIHDDVLEKAKQFEFDEVMRLLPYWSFDDDVKAPPSEAMMSIKNSRSGGVSSRSHQNEDTLIMKECKNVLNGMVRQVVAEHKQEKTISRLLKQLVRKVEVRERKIQADIIRKQREEERTQITIANTMDSMLRTVELRILSEERKEREDRVRGLKQLDRVDKLAQRIQDRRKLMLEHEGDSEFFSRLALEDMEEHTRKIQRQRKRALVRFFYEFLLFLSVFLSASFLTISPSTRIPVYFSPFFQF